MGSWKGVSIQEGETSNKMRCGDGSGILYQAEDWVIAKQLGTRLTFSEFVHTTLILDIVLWSLGTKNIIAVQRIEPREENVLRPVRRRRQHMRTLCQNAGNRDGIVGASLVKHKYYLPNQCDKCLVP